MKKIIVSAILGILASGACIAEDFNYDDDTRIEVSTEDWGDDSDPSVNIEFGDEDDPTSGVNKINSDGALRVSLRDGRLMIDAVAACRVMAYDTNGRIAKMLNVNPGNNVFTMPRGIYIILGRKYKF